MECNVCNVCSVCTECNVMYVMYVCMHACMHACNVCNVCTQCSVVHVTLGRFGNVGCVSFTFPWFLCLNLQTILCLMIFVTFPTNTIVIRFFYVSKCVSNASTRWVRIVAFDEVVPNRCLLTFPTHFQYVFITFPGLCANMPWIGALWLVRFRDVSTASARDGSNTFPTFIGTLLSRFQVRMPRKLDT